MYLGAVSLEHDQQQGLELGAVDYIEKPFDAQDFVSRILFTRQRKGNGMKQKSDKSRWIYSTPFAAGKEFPPIATQGRIQTHQRW